MHPVGRPLFYPVSIVDSCERMKEILEKFKSVFDSPYDILLMARIAAWIVVTPVLIRILPLPSLMAFLTPTGTSNSTPQDYKDKVINYTFLLLGRQKAMFQRNCLKRCLVVYRFLRLAGEPARIFFGVRKENGKLAGHSWLEVDGRLVFEEPEIYKVTYSYPND